MCRYTSALQKYARTTFQDLHFTLLVTILTSWQQKHLAVDAAHFHYEKEATQKLTINHTDLIFSIVCLKQIIKKGE